MTMHMTRRELGEIRGQKIPVAVDSPNTEPARGCSGNDPIGRNITAQDADSSYIRGNAHLTKQAISFTASDNPRHVAVVRKPEEHIQVNPSLCLTLDEAALTPAQKAQVADAKQKSLARAVPSTPKHAKQTLLSDHGIRSSSPRCDSFNHAAASPSTGRGRQARATTTLPRSGPLSTSSRTAALTFKNEDVALRDNRDVNIASNDTPSSRSDTWPPSHHRTLPPLRKGPVGSEGSFYIWSKLAAELEDLAHRPGPQDQADSGRLKRSHGGAEGDAATVY
ncbi:hypothetical protein BU16DRAFT_554065 [Lophium mytilinum]|uniref:Uncharacterized protein n=1 Tax=Lophium mytilinum TaxID=390894 RepID=A0A6A6RC95_9PEZI|nr:hypothetical protein BU16DRAFT_554065 [Lophium mytilinum]